MKQYVHFRLTTDSNGNLKLKRVGELEVDYVPNASLFDDEKMMRRRATNDKNEDQAYIRL